MFFVYLGSLDNIKSIGTNTLIKNGAKLALTPEDIVINYDFLHRIEKNSLNPVYENDIAKEYKQLYTVITAEPIELDEIIKKCRLPIEDVISKLTALELDGKILKLPGNRFVRI